MRHALSRRLPYTADQLFDLVGDVEAYPQFVPWITDMRVWNPRQEGEVSLLDAEAGVGFSFIRERFSTRVRRDPARREITVTLINGPFRKLINQWRFREEPAGSTIEFSIEFEFKSMMLEMMLAANMERAVQKLIGCFEARAKALYG